MTIKRRLETEKIFQIEESALRELMQEVMEDFFKPKETCSQGSDPELLTRREAANFLGVKENTMSVWSVRGTGPPPTKIGSCVRYRRSELKKYINENTTPR